MTHDDTREASAGARSHAPSATAAAPPVDPFRMAISELQEDLCSLAPSVSEPPPAFAPNVLAVTPASPAGPMSAGVPRATEPTEREQAPSPPLAPVPLKIEPAWPPAPRVVIPELTKARPNRLLPTAAVALFCGLIGGGITGGFFAGGKTEDADPGTPAPSSVRDERTTPSPDGTPSPNEALAEDLKALRSQTDTLAKRISAFAGRLDELPRPEPLPDLSSLRNQVDDLSKITSRSAPLPARIQQLDGRAQQLDEGLKAVRDQVASLQTAIETMTAKADTVKANAGNVATPPDLLQTMTAKADAVKANAPKTETPQAPQTESPKTATANAETPKAETPAPTIPLTVAPPPSEDRAVPTPAPEEEPGSETDRALAQGAELFRQGKYKEALGIFNKLELTRPNDARVWYFAALSYGFATSQWGGGTVRLVEKGVEREQAGTPATTQIDAAFRDLSADRGKEWLNGYRKLVKTR